VTGVGTAAGAVLIADLTGPADIHGVHGAAGLTHWKCLASGHDLMSEVEAVEWASIPPGGVSGEHRHTRTEESYFILRGQGEIYLDGQPHPVGAGSLILTGLGTVHGLRNTGSTDLDWLVIEVRSPGTSDALLGRSQDMTVVTSRNPTEAHMNAAIHDLGEPGESAESGALRRVDPGDLLTGPLRLIERRSLEPGTTWDLRAVGSEHTVFVLSGDGWAAADDATADLRAWTSVTLPLGTSARFGAGRHGLEVFHAELTVPDAALVSAAAEGHR